MIRDDVTVTREDGKLTMEREGLSYTAVLSRDRKLVAGFYLVALLAGLIWCAIVGGWDQYDSWAGYLFGAFLGGTVAVAIHVEKCRLGWVIFANTEILRIAQDSGAGWYSDEVQLNEELTLWVDKGIFRRVMRLASGEVTLALDSDLSETQLVEVGELIADHLGLAREPDETVVARWRFSPRKPEV